MLDIEYIKQIDEMLEIQDFTVQENKCIIYLWHLNRGFDFNYLITENCEYRDTFYKTIYPLYLQRVIEAINKDWTKADSDNYYWICQNYDDIEVYEQSSKREVFTLGVDCRSIDECKESAITYIMDHIKEKV